MGAAMDEIGGRCLSASRSNRLDRLTEVENRGAARAHSSIAATVGEAESMTPRQCASVRFRPIADMRRGRQCSFMASPELRSLVDALARTRNLLQQYGDTFTARRLQELEERLNGGDTSAVVSAVSEAGGGMGSLNDRYLCPQNGDAIEQAEVVGANARLRGLVTEVGQRARAAAAAHAIPRVS